MIGQTIVFISLILLIIKLNGVQYLPVIFLLITAGWYFILALSAYTQLFFHAFAFIIIAFSFYILNIDHRVMVPVVSTIIGISSLTVAFTTTYKKSQSSRTDRAG
ncbi:MAG: hypothetical protein GXP33_15600 [Spirochaetes bacterium]|nr:hypothetical protein [Spirochaetota bacterium]